MIRLFKKIFGRKERTSGQVALSRLHSVLSSDRTSISGCLFEKMKEEIIGCICKYANIDVEKVHFDIKRGEKNTCTILQTSVPIFSYKEPVQEVLAS